MEGQGKVTGYMSICLCFKIHDQICKVRHSGYLNIGTQIQAQWNIFKSSGDQPLCWHSVLEQIQIKGPYLDKDYHSMKAYTPWVYQKEIKSYTLGSKMSLNVITVKLFLY